MKNIMAKGMAQKSCKALLSLRSLGFSRKFAEILLRSKYNWDKKFLGREYTSTTMWQIRKAVFNSNPLKYKFITLNNISLCNILCRHDSINIFILTTFTKMLFWPPVKFTFEICAELSYLTISMAQREACDVQCT